jgi:hypothetical protein
VLGAVEDASRRLRRCPKRHPRPRLRAALRRGARSGRRDGHGCGRTKGWNRVMRPLAWRRIRDRTGFGGRAWRRGGLWRGIAGSPPPANRRPRRSWQSRAGWSASFRRSPGWSSRNSPRRGAAKKSLASKGGDAAPLRTIFGAQCGRQDREVGEPSIRVGAGSRAGAGSLDRGSPATNLDHAPPTRGSEPDQPSPMLPVARIGRR